VRGVAAGVMEAGDQHDLVRVGTRGVRHRGQFGLRVADSRLFRTRNLCSAYPVAVISRGMAGKLSRGFVTPARDARHIRALTPNL